MLFRDNKNSTQNDTSDNQYDWNDSEILEIGGFKYSYKIGKSEDDNKYVLGNKGDSFQDKLLKNVLDNRKKTTNTMQTFCH